MGAGGMTRKNQVTRGQKVLIGGLSIILVAVCVRLVRPGPDAGLAAAPTPSGDASTPAGDAPPAAPGPLNVIAWPAAAARDPFRSAKVYPPAAPRAAAPATAPAPAAPRVDLNALARETVHLKGTVQGERPVAMVNGRLCRVGDAVGEFRIVEISKQTITVQKSGVRVVVEPD